MRSPAAAAASGEWLEATLRDLSHRVEGLELDDGLISGLVSFCELASPEDAKDYLINIVGLDRGQDVIQHYLHMRSDLESPTSIEDVQNLNVQAYMKQPAKDSVVSKKQPKAPKVSSAAPAQVKKQTETAELSINSKGNSTTSRKKKTGKIISLAEAAKGSVVFQQGKPCSCQARRHRLVTNCLSCGKIVCEQEGEGPCSFCGALVLKESSTYADLDDQVAPLSDAEATAEAYAKRLVEYDRNAAARTKVIDDQSDYYETEGNSWLSIEERRRLKQQEKEAEEAKEILKKKLVVTFDLVGRQVVRHEEEVEAVSSILRPPELRETNRMKPNPSIKVQPVFVETGRARQPSKEKEKRTSANSVCLEISGRVQYDGNAISFDHGFQHEGDDPECSFN